MSPEPINEVEMFKSPCGCQWEMDNGEPVAVCPEHKMKHFCAGQFKGYPCGNDLVTDHAGNKRCYYCYRLMSGGKAEE